MSAVLSRVAAPEVIAAVTQRVAEHDALIEQGEHDLRCLANRLGQTVNETTIFRLKTEANRIEAQLAAARRERAWDAERLALLCGHTAGGA